MRVVWFKKMFSAWGGPQSVLLFLAVLSLIGSTGILWLGAKPTYIFLIRVKKVHLPQHIFRLVPYFVGKKKHVSQFSGPLCNVLNRRNELMLMHLFGSILLAKLLGKTLLCKAFQANDMKSSKFGQMQLM